MKTPAKIFGIVLTCFAVLVLSCSCATFDESTDGNSSDNTPEAVNPAEPPENSADDSAGLTATRPEEKPLESSGDLGNYHVEIGECSIEKDYNGKPAAVISYVFTNNDDEANSAMVALSDRAFQNGVSLESAYFMDDSVVNSADLMKDVQPGSSIEIKQGYLLSSESAPIEFEITELISFNDSKLGKTFVIDEAGKTEYPSAPQGGISGKLGDYDVSILSSEIGDNYDDGDVLIVHYGFTNNSKKDASFILSITDKAFQNGIELENAYFADSNDASSLYIKPGVGIEVVVAYELPDTSTPVDIELSELMSFSDDKITTTIQLG